jgi:hypothetical protein
MNSVILERPREPGRRVAIPLGQLVLLLMVLGFGLPLISVTVTDGALSAVALLCFVSIAGFLLCRNVRLRLRDPSLKVLGYLWLIKIAVTLFLLYAGWIPQLDPGSVAWGYDPQRYYVQAQELIENGWSPEFVSINYAGILYYYALIFYAFGHNPVAPALVNAFLTLVATVYLIKVGYEVKRHREPWDWTLAFALLLPELLWFDVMTSRETFVAAFLLFATLTTGRYLARTANLSLTTVVLGTAFSALAVAAVRASMILPIFISVLLMVLFVRLRRGSRLLQRTMLAFTAGVALIIAPVIVTQVGGYQFDIFNAIQNVISAKGNIASSSAVEWQANSIGVLLLPNGFAQAILFLPARMMLYLVAPLPHVFVSLNSLAAGSWEAWQNLSVMLSSVTNVLVFPYAVASLFQSIGRRKENPAPLVLHIPYWATFAAIAGGNLIIQERYRIMATLLLWGCAWLGARTCTRRLIVGSSMVWYGLLTFGALFYLGYKGA